MVQRGSVVKLLSPDDLRSKKGVCLSRSQRNRLIKAGRFPRPVRIGGRNVAWVEAEVDAWSASLIAERDTAKSNDAPAMQEAV
jgi:prophage regulatory protein